MSRAVFAACFAVLAFVHGACNDVGDCPSTITPGASCEGDSLTCPYTIQAAGVSCPTSCTCTNGSWSCPDPSGCVPAATGDDGAATGDDGGSSDDGGGE
jgi:hypothetical protein